MKITITPHALGAKPVTLAGTGAESVSGLVVANQRATQLMEYLRADERDVVARGNRGTTLSFSVTRQHAGIREAETFVVTHGAELPPEGLLTVTAAGSNGATAELYMDAVLESEEGRHIGCTTIFNYRLLGRGRLSKTKPASA